MSDSATISPPDAQERLKCNTPTPTGMYGSSALRHPLALPEESPLETAQRIGYYRFATLDPQAWRICRQIENERTACRKSAVAARVKALRKGKKT